MRGFRRQPDAQQRLGRNSRSGIPLSAESVGLISPVHSTGQVKKEWVMRLLESGSNIKYPPTALTGIKPNSANPIPRGVPASSPLSPIHPHLCTQPPRKTVCYICSSSLSPGCTTSPFPPPTPGALPAMVLVIPPPIWPPPPDSPKMYRTLAGWATAGVAVRALQLGILQQPLRTGELMTSPFFVSRSSRWKEGKGWEMS